jgi:hypothetical protein
MLSACRWVQLQTEGASVDGSQCGLCNTYYIAYVQDLCAFLGDGVSRVGVPSPPPLLV